MTRILVKTFIDINCAEFSSKSSALADRALQSFLAHAVVLTRIGITILAVVTSLATQLWRTLAVKVVLEIDALGAVKARAARARVEVILAPGAGEARRTRARKSGRGGELQTRATVLTRGRATSPGLTQCIAFKFNVCKPFQLCHLTVTIDVKRNGNMVQLNVIHASNKAPTDFNHLCGGVGDNHVGPKVNVALLQVQDVVEAGCGAVSSPLAVHADLGAVAVPLELDLVPVPVIDHLVIQSHETLATPEIEAVL